VLITLKFQRRQGREFDPRSDHSFCPFLAPFVVEVESVVFLGFGIYVLSGEDGVGREHRMETLIELKHLRSFPLFISTA
jgi:hypothetical protein